MYNKKTLIISRYYPFENGESKTVEFEPLRKSDLRSLSINGVAVIIDGDTVVEVTLSKTSKRFSTVNLKDDDPRLKAIASKTDNCLYYIGGALFARDEHQPAIGLDIYLRYNMAAHTIEGVVEGRLPDEIDKAITSVELSFLLEVEPMGDPAENNHTTPVPKELPL